jgi:nucleoid-associated protein YgaU
LPEIYLRTSLEGMLYAPTTYVPTDVADVPWPSITVTAEDLRAYADKAPAELKERLGGSEDAGVERVTFEYSYVTVNRPWFTPQLFNSQAWRFPDPGHVLSDGGSPPKGECTAYVTGLVLARNIAVQRSIPADTPDEPAIDLAFMPAQLSNLTVQARVFGETPVTGAKAMVVLDDPTVWKAVAVATTPHIATATPAVRRLDALSVSRMRVVGIPSIRTPIVGLPPPIEPAPPPPPHPTPPPPPPPQSETTTTDPTDVFVLALQCRLLPKSPYQQGARSDASKVYIVKRRDTLAKIAGRVYGDKDKWKALYEANRDVIGPNPALIRPGQRLQVP